MKLVEFFRQGLLWTIDASQLPRLRRWALHAMRRSVMSVELFLSRNLSAHAAALTYSSVLSAVPILAIIFAISRGFGFNQLIEEKLKANVRFTPEMTQSIMDFVNSYLERAKGGVFIGVGLVMLFYTLINLTSNITSLVVFLLNGQVVFLLGLAGALCNMAGNWLGSGLALNKGSRIVRPVILGVLLLLFLKLIIGF